MWYSICWLRQLRFGIYEHKSSVHQADPKSAVARHFADGNHSQLLSHRLWLTRWQRLYPGYFSFILVQWEEVATCCLSILQSTILTQKLTSLSLVCSSQLLVLLPGPYTPVCSLGEWGVESRNNRHRSRREKCCHMLPPVIQK